MSKKEIDKYEIIKRTIRGELTVKDAARLLALSVRHTKRLKAAVRQRGAAGLIHGNRGKPGNRRLADNKRAKIIKLLKKHYYDFGPTLASEKLETNHGLDLDPKTIRQIMITEKLWHPKTKPEQQTHRSWRERKSAYGEMVQFDGSYEHWFEDRAGTGEVCLLAAIDDATGQLVQAQFAAHEGVFPVLAFWREYIVREGKPRAIYLDKFSTYRTPTKYLAENHELKTQFQRALSALAIEPIFAHSPQAKGRVERLFGILQDRLIKELRLAGINGINDANQFLKGTFIPWFNQRFAVIPRQTANLHRPLTQPEQSSLAGIFSRHARRTVQNDFTISFGQQWYQLTAAQAVTICKRDVVAVEEWLDGSLHIRLRGKEINYCLLPARPKPSCIQPWVLAATAPDSHQQLIHKPAADHPWRRRIQANIATHLAVRG